MAPRINPKDLCPSCPTVLPSDICFDCGKLSKFLVAYPELEANQPSTGLTNSYSTNSHKRYTRLRRERKLEYRANKPVVKRNELSWQFNLDGGIRDEEIHGDCGLPAQDIPDSQECFGIQTEDIHVYYDIWEEFAQDESTLLEDEDLNLHYLGHNLMASLDMPAADNQSSSALLDNVRYLSHNLMASLDLAADNQFDADDEASEYGDADASFAPNSLVVKMAQRCGTLQWEPSLPVERIPRKAQGLYNHLCEWNFADATTSCAGSGTTLVDDDEISPLDSGRKFSFDEGGEEELDRGFWRSVDGEGDGYCSDSSEATVRDLVVECRRVVGGLAYEWDILL